MMSQPPPTERVQQANRQRADLLLSIHGNSAATEASGFECYPITPGRTWHRESVYFARLLAEGMQAAGSTLRGQGGVRYIYYQQGQKVLAEANDLQIRDEETFTVLEQAGLSGCAGGTVLCDECRGCGPVWRRRWLPAGRQSLLPGHLCLFRHHAFWNRPRRKRMAAAHRQRLILSACKKPDGCAHTRFSDRKG